VIVTLKLFTTGNTETTVSLQSFLDEEGVPDEWERA
jgi:hypothetical protein